MLKFISLNIKASLIYTALALLIITVITTLIFENQSDLIVKNTLLESQIKINTLLTDIDNAHILAEARDEKLTAKLTPLLKAYSSGTFTVYNERGDILATSMKHPPATHAVNNDFTNINRAIFNRENNRKLFYAAFSGSVRSMQKKRINFFIPLRKHSGSYIIIKLPLYGSAIEQRMGYLYRQIGILISGMLVIILFIALLFRRIIIRPIEQISRVSKIVAGGDFSAAATCTSNDELGVLATQFNAMVRSLDEKTVMLNDTINTLETQNTLIQHELDIANKIQGGMLPNADSLQGLRLTPLFMPLEKISGDFYDIIEFPDGSVGIIIVDVSGHGIPAALITIMIKILVSTYGLDYLSPADFLKKLNSELAKVITTGDFIVAFYIIIGPDHTVRYSSAGNNSAIVQKTDAVELSELYDEGLFLGIIENAAVKYNVNSMQLNTGDRLVLFTDGIPEQRNIHGEMYGEERLQSLIIEHKNKDSQELMNAVVDSFKTFMGTAPQDDDITLLIIDM